MPTVVNIVLQLQQSSSFEKQLHLIRLQWRKAKRSNNDWKMCMGDSNKRNDNNQVTFVEYAHSLGVQM